MENKTYQLWIISIRMSSLSLFSELWSWPKQHRFEVGHVRFARLPLVSFLGDEFKRGVPFLIGLHSEKILWKFPAYQMWSVQKNAMCLQHFGSLSHFYASIDSMSVSNFLMSSITAVRSFSSRLPFHQALEDCVLVALMSRNMAKYVSFLVMTSANDDDDFSTPNFSNIHAFNFLSVHEIKCW